MECDLTRILRYSYPLHDGKMSSLFICSWTSYKLLIFVFFLTTDTIKPEKINISLVFHMNKPHTFVPTSNDRIELDQIR